MTRSFFILAFAVITAGCVTHYRFSPAPTATFKRATPQTISYSDSVGILRYESHPMVRASINGVSGDFLIDTGATIPILGVEAARRCRFKPFWPPEKDPTYSLWGEKRRMMKATNLVVELAPGVAVHWPEVLVSWETNFFGIIDYRTLRAANAVIDTKNKTITFAQ